MRTQPGGATAPQHGSNGRRRPASEGEREPLEQMATPERCAVSPGGIAGR